MNVKKPIIYFVGYVLTSLLIAGCIVAIINLFGYEEGLFYCAVFYSCFVALFFVINTLYSLMSIRLIQCDKIWLFWVIWGLFMSVLYSLLWVCFFILLTHSLAIPLHTFNIKALCYHDEQKTSEK